MLLTKNIAIFDGAMGTMLTELTENQGVSIEELNIISAEKIQEIHRKYVEAGADFITTNTFGANRNKLKNNQFQLNEILTAAIENARKATQNSSVKVIFDIGPSGKLLEPFGDLSFEEAYDAVKEIVELTKSHVDGYLLETYVDLAEMKAAVLAVKENCDLPLFATMTFDETGRTLTGSTPEIVALTLTSLHVDAIGINCSTGPDKMVDLVRKMRKFSHLPILVQPNKGLPTLEKGKITYSFSDTDFDFWIQKIIEAGATIIGGCCGTTPETIRNITHYKNLKVANYQPIRETFICSSTRLLKLEKGIVCGERLNPTGKKTLQKALLEGDFVYLQQEALQQESAGADFLDINVGIPNCDEKKLIVEAVKKVQEVCELPLQIDSAKPEAIAAAARVYVGVPMINSVNGDEDSMRKIFPIIAKYGAFSVALTLTKNGIPKTANERFEVAKTIISEAKKYGIEQRQLVFDPLVMTISSDTQHGQITLQTISLLKSLNILTIIGLSNISFGLPQRAFLNRTFLIMALQTGLDIAIMNPNDSDSMVMIKAYKALSGQDKNCEKFIEKANGVQKEIAKNQTVTTISDAILQGIKTNIKPLVDQELTTKTPEEIINGILVPTLETVGKKFEEKTLFLPQLINSAEVAKAVFAELSCHFSQEKDNLKGKIVLATVRGDIHDIGKNIVKIVLESHGFQVVDLGKNVPIEAIVDAYHTHQPIAIGLSALMTTTVEAMEQTIKVLKKDKNMCPIIVGGAVVTPNLAKQIGAYLYGHDALDTVKKLELLIKNA